MSAEVKGAALGSSDDMMGGMRKSKSKVVAPRNPKLLKGLQPEVKLRPSVYLTQMSMDTEEWLANQRTMKLPAKIELLDMAETTNQKVSSVSIDEPLFQPYPSEICFQRFKLFETYEVPLVLRNNDKVPRLLKITQEPSPYFKLISPANASHKVGPGLPTTCKVQFSPESDQDYTHELICVTEREKFVVPVKAFGSRAILDFPDFIDFPRGLVKYSNTKTLLIRNIGTKDGKFQLTAEKPFAVSPVSGVIPVNGSLQVTVDFHPLTVGEHSGEILLHYDAGEDVYIRLHGVAENAAVRLEKSTIRVEKTFISLANQRTVTISNHSDVIAHFHWSRFATQEEEQQQKILLKDNLLDSEANETDRFYQECEIDPTIADKISIIRRSYQNKKNRINEDPMLFVDDVIKIDPIEADIWPKSSMDVTVVFQPEEAKEYNRIAFCDVTGREARLPLRIQGEGIGPNVQFSFDQIDMGNIYVFSTHVYELILANKGDIDAMYSLLPSNTSYRPCFQLNPSEGIIMPGGHQAIQVSFSSRVVGSFSEEFCFQVDGLPSPVTVAFVGSVIAPTFSFDVPKLRFGTVSYGFTSSKTCILRNTSLIPMTFYLRIPSDGNGPVVSCLSEFTEESSGSDSRLSFSDPKEFEIVPASGVLAPQSEIEITVSLCSNTRRHYDAAMVVDVEGVALELFSLPISAKCIVPSIVVMNPRLELGRCFIGYPYMQTVEMQNSSDLPAKYRLIACIDDGLESLSYCSPQSQGIIEPQSTLSVPLEIIPRGLGDLDATINFKIIGASEMILPIYVHCIGEGPVIHLTPSSLDWGQIQVLTEVSKVVKVSNESLIPAHFTAEMIHSGSVWTVEPSSGIIEPEETIELLVTACLDDSVCFSDKLQVHIQGGSTHSVSLSAIGQGTTIVCQPPMPSTFDLGPHFSKGGCRRTFTLVNRGRRHQSIVWHTDGFPLLTRSRRPARSIPTNSKDIKYKDHPPPSDPPSPVFTITPQRLELNPGDSAEVVLDGNVDCEQIVRETLLCNAIIGRSGGKELIKMVKIICEFINPLIEFSSDTVSFSVNKAPGDELSILTNSLELTNVTSLPLTIQLGLSFPFFFSKAGQKMETEQEISVDVDEKREVQIQFDPAYISDLHSRSIDDVMTVSYVEHPHVDKIKLRGEVFFPNLHFEKMEVDFGCILNDTEVTRYINITNNSPLEVSYRWSFMLDDEPVAVFRKSTQVQKKSLDLESRDLESRQAEDEGKEIYDETEERLKEAEAVEELDVAIEAGSPRNATQSPPQQDRLLEIVDKEAIVTGENERDEEKKDQEKLPDSPKEPDNDNIWIDAPVHSREPSQLTLSKVIPEINPNLAAILHKDENSPSTPAVEEIFDILPIYGVLKPGDTQLITLTFYGHAHFDSRAKAICEVLGGPTYEILFKGEASLIDYKFDYLEIDYNKVMYDQVASSQITLMNTGHVGFDFVALGMDPALANHPKPGVPIMIPHRGHIEPLSEKILTIKYLPSGPQKFHSSFQIQVAHFEPDSVNIYGEGVFPRLTLDLPRAGDEDGTCERLLAKAKDKLAKEMNRKFNRPASCVSETDEALGYGQIQTKFMPSEIEIQMEMERLIIQEFVDQQILSSSQPDILVVHSEPHPPSISQTPSKKFRKTMAKPKPRLPDYLLDFGHVVLGAVCKRTVNVTNTGWFQASFSVDRKSLVTLKQLGFTVEMPKVVQLPGAPDHETISFEVTFDPRGANLEIGEAEAVMPINIFGGPQVYLRLKAVVTIPDMQVSTDVIDFGDVKCGECCFVTIQLHNHQKVRCEWSFAPPSDKDKKQTDKHLPMHLRRKTRVEKVTPPVFEVIPSAGALFPGQRQNIQVKFMPTEQKLYESSLGIKLSQSSQRIVIRCSGQGLEPQLELDKQLLEFGPILPHSNGDEKEIVIRNPCSFPVEIYNLEFDKIYLEEEKILRLMKGYDEYGTLLLPPRQPAEKLPQEILDYYDDQIQKLEEAERLRREHEVEEAAEIALRESAIAAEATNLEGDNTESSKVFEKVSESSKLPSQTASKIADDKMSRHSVHLDKSKSESLTMSEREKVAEKSSPYGSVGELEVTPVSASIARHLGIDLSEEGTAARHRRGIAIIVHGAPKSGKSPVANSLAKMYGAALLTIDAVIIEAMETGRLPAGQRARELCTEAANQILESQRNLAETEDGEKKPLGGNLSIEAVAAHVQGTGQVTISHVMPQTTVSNRKTSTISDTKTTKTDRHHSLAAGARGALASSGDGTSQQNAASPCPVTAPVARRLSISGGDEELWSTILPDDLVVNILAERLMMKDCHQGVIFDGLESLFTQNVHNSAQCILKAINNRKYIYGVGLKLDYTIIKEKEKKMEAEKERLQHEKEKEEKQHLEEMSEDEYDALTEEEKAKIEQKRLEIKRERMKREKAEQLEKKQKEEKERMEAELRRQEEEKLAKRRKGRGGPSAGTKDGKKTASPGKQAEQKPPRVLERKKSHDGEHGFGKAENKSDLSGEKTERGESALDDKKKKDKVTRDGKQVGPTDGQERGKGKGKELEKDGDTDHEEPVKQLSEAELLLIQRFRVFERHFKDVCFLFDWWERSLGMLHPLTPSEGGGPDGTDDVPPTQAGKKTKKTLHEKQSRMEKERNREPKDQQVTESNEAGVDGNQEQGAADEEKQERRLQDGIGIPHIIVNCYHTDKEPFVAVRDSGRLPLPEEVLDGLGLGPKGPPIPPPAKFSVVPFPVKRQVPPGAESGHYHFIFSPPEDVHQEEKPSEQDSEETKADDRKEMTSVSRASRRGGAAEKSTKVDKEKLAEKRKKSSSSRTRGRRNSIMTATPPLGAATPASENDGSEESGRISILTIPDAKVSPKQFRWVIPAEGEITLKLSFTSEDLGQFDQTFNFEIVATRRRYQLYCRGVCAFPIISREPRIVFPQRKKSQKPDEILQKTFVMSSDTFEFGPLLVGKSRDRYKEERYPENLEKLTIMNSSPMETEVSFCFLSDSKGETFLLEPPTMTLKPSEKQVLTVWAYPKLPHTYEDSLVCCIKENPEPVIFKLVCHGTRPELELDKKVLHFDKVLLHRKDTKTLCLKNNTLLPVAWRLNGLDNLGDDFSVSMEQGVVPAKTDFSLNFFFKAIKPINTNKKSIRIEVSDVDNILGLVQTESIQIHAEAYDVALDMSFPKGADGGIDFDTVRIPEEGKQACTLKNKGKYDISYCFKFEPTLECPLELCKLFSVTPDHATLSPTERPATIQVSFQSNKEVVIQDQPILRCEVIEPNIAEGGETIASIPIKISAKSVFSKYSINPSNDLNFGALLVNSKKTRTFMIENRGEKFDLKYVITKTVKAEVKVPVPPETKPGKAAKRNELQAKANDESFSSKSGTKSKRNESMRPEPAGSNQTRLVLGMFTVYPAIGSVAAGGQITIQVDCVAESQGKCEEDVTIDIIGRDPKDNPGGIPYRLIAEACIPSINVDDIGSIFEEHRICKNLNVTSSIQGLQSAGGIYGEEEKKFVFSNVLVGSKIKSRFKISNIRKVPCDIVFCIKPVAAKGSKQMTEVFEVTPTRAQIAAHGHVYATVTFCPTVMQQYNALFEAYIETVPQNQPKGRALIFELSGEGNLPHVLITKPAVHNKKGQPLLLFKRSLVGRTQSLPVVVTNDGTLTCKVDMELTDPDEVFAILLKDNKQGGNQSSKGIKKTKAASIILDVGETVSFEVSFHADLPQRSQGQLRLSVVNNQYEETVIQLVGEGYQDTITIDNIQSSLTEMDHESDEGNMADDDIPAAKCNLMKFGDCFISEAKSLSCTLANHSESDNIRFAWPDHPQLKFSPQVGHLLASSAKDISVSFKTDQPIKFQELEILCTVTKIAYDRTSSNGEISDWDDRLKTVKWVDVSSSDRSVKAGGMQPPASGSLPAKRKVVETEPEPVNSEVPNSTSTVSLLVSANGDFCKYKLAEESLHFRDTLMFQTRVHQLHLQNTGTVPLEYNWMVVMDDFTRSRRSCMDDRSTLAGIDTPRPATACPLLANSDDLRPISVDSGLISGTPFIPFNIEPENGTVAPGRAVSLSVKFSPLDVSDYEARLICSIPNLEPGTHGPVIGLKARSLMPYCHFELEDSDYLRSARRNPELPGPGGLPAGTTLDPNTRVIEFKCVGVGVKCRKQFSIINPTNQNYTFQWTCKDMTNTKKISEFACLSSLGSINSGKKSEVIFEFVSSSLDLVESFWRFEIPEQNIVLPFLLVGQTRDPNVAFDRSHINFRTILIGHNAMDTITMINDETEGFDFTFDDASCHSTAFTARLVIEPKLGTIAPKSRLPISIHFSPKLEKEVNFNIVCHIKKKTFPLTLNVKAEGFSMNSLVLCEDSAGGKLELSSTSPNIINFGRVEVNEKAVRNISILNLGKFSFDYTWELKDQVTSTIQGRQGTVAISSQSGGVGQGENVSCVLSFLPPQPMSLRNCELILRIAHGPTYTMQLQGVGILPGIHLSFTSYNFGASFIYRAGLPVRSVVLKLTNNDTKSISVECLTTPTAWLHHNFDAVLIAPQQTFDVTFTFYPREAIKYKETVTFEINGLSKQTVEFTGQGTEMKIEVADSRQKVVKFGAMKVGQTLKKIVPIVNNSPAPISFRLALNPTSPALQEPGVVKFTPTDEITLQPKGGTTKVEVVMSPKTRVAQFSEEIQLECAGLYQTLFIITGSCQGLEIGLNTDSIPFGAVVLKSSSNRQLILTNSGDIGARFKWDISRLGPHFSISPTEGYISSGLDVSFDVLFHPQEISSDIRSDNIKCQIEGGKPLKLTLTGTCVGVPPTKEIYHFSTCVRQKETKNLQLANHTNLAWNLRPIIDGEHWSGPETIHVPPQTTKMYELIYHPLAMTVEGKKHTGSVFFPLPDGTGIMFNVSGSAEAPKPNEKITRDIPCKTTYTEMLRVQNWIKKPQRFRAKIENMRSDKFDQSLTIKGLDYIDVPGLSAKDYKLAFHAHKECQPQIKVTFTNEQTGEYQYFELYFRAVRPGVISSIQLSTPVRQSKQHTLLLENPLNNAVTFSASCNIPEIQLPGQLSVPALSEGAFTFDFFPLKVGTTQGKLEFTSNDLGLYIYDLEAKATSAGPERALHFKTCLGTSQTQFAKFLNYTKHKTDYTCKLDHPDYHVDKSIAAASAPISGTEVAIEVTYEPSSIGESHATLTINSPLGGDYSFPIFGVCTTPKPQGPFTVKSGATVNITFRNVFPQTTAFTFQVDNPLFHVAKPGENIRAHKEHRIIVGFDGNDGPSKAPVMGKLTVSCALSAGSLGATQWVYYLKGITPEGK